MPNLKTIIFFGALLAMGAGGIFALLRGYWAIGLVMLAIVALIALALYLLFRLGPHITGGG